MEEVYFNVLVKEKLLPNYSKYFYLEKKWNNSRPWELNHTCNSLEDISNEISRCNIITPQINYIILSESFHNKEKSFEIGIKKENKNHSIVRALNQTEQRDLIRYIDQNGYAE